jgi:hypothetical protein
MKIDRWIGIALFVLLLPVAAFAQVDSGRISGTVSDSTGAFVAGAKVTVTNEKTGEARTITTNMEGFFLMSALKPSTYTIKVEQPGFAAIEYTGMTLALGAELPLDFQISPAALQEAVTVVGVAPILDISSAKIGANVSEREVGALPVNGRQMSQLMLQAPAAQNTGTGTWSDVRFAGRAVEQNVIRYDGVEASSIISSSPGQNNAEVATPFKLQASLENVQEFRVESSGYPAEFGTGTGGQISVITKSGGNALRGSVFDYFRDDSLDAPNYFDKLAGFDKSPLRQTQFGASLGGPIARNRAFFFGSYEGYRLNAGVNIIEAAPSGAAWARTTDSRILALRPGFVHPDAVLVTGAGKSTNADFDVWQYRPEQVVREDAFSGRLDLRFSNNWSSYLRVSHDQGKADLPESISGRLMRATNNPTNAVFNLQHISSGGIINETKIGFNHVPTTIDGVLPNPVINGIDFSKLVINISGSVANSGIAGQGSSSGQVIPGGLVRSNSSTNGRAQPYDPYSLTLSNALSTIKGNHALKVGGEFRAIRMSTNRLGGTTYTYSNLAAFLANNATVRYDDDLSNPSPYNPGATGERHAQQEYIVGFAQDEWRMTPKLTLNYGLRYDFYNALRERDDHQVVVDIRSGSILPSSDSPLKGKKSNFQPRVSATFSPDEKTVVRGGFGLFVGPGQTEDQIQLIESDRISFSLSGKAFPFDSQTLIDSFGSSPNTRSANVRAYSNDYAFPERVYQYTASVQRELPGRLGASIAYVGSQGRNLFLRSITNQITRLIQPDQTRAATVVREFSIVLPDGVTVQNPWGEIDYKTSGGHDSYNAMQLSLTRRSAQGLTMNGQYTLSRSRGNTAGSNEALTAGNNASFGAERPENRTNAADFDYDNGYNRFDVRHNFNLSAVYTLPFGRGKGGAVEALLGNWDLGLIFNSRSGSPIDVQITRPDVVYVDGAGNVFANPAAGRTGVINTPGGGASRDVRRPDVVPGVDPIIKDYRTGLFYLNPAAFTTPKPGTNGNFERNSIKGPGFKQVDLVVAKRVTLMGTRNFEFRVEIFNLFNTTNFANPSGKLSSALPNDLLTEANRLQPGQPFTSAAAGGSFGALRGTVGRTVGLGTNRQVQLGMRVNF